MPVLGTHGMYKIRSTSVLITGCKGLGIEVAKNLILLGVGRITLHDDTLVCLSDLGSNFCLSEFDVSTNSRAKCSVETLRKLNEECEVSVFEGDI